MKTKQELKDVFNGLSSLLYQSAVVDLSQSILSITPEYDLPVAVDTLQISQEDPTVNHYKVIGLDGDWTSSATLGNMNIQFTVPTKAKEVLQLAYGEDAVKEITKLTINTGDADIDSAQGYHGVSLSLKKKKVTGTFVLVDEAKENLMIITNVALWAKPLYENPGTEPFAIQFTGTMEGAGSQSIAWLKKGAGAVQLTYQTDKATTRKLIPEGQRSTGLVITYNPGDGVIKEQYKDTRFDDEQWAKDDNWVTIS